MCFRKLDGSQYGQNESFQSDQYKSFFDIDIEIMYQRSTIKRYIENLQNVQSLEEYEYYPIKEEYLKDFFEVIKPNFKQYTSLKYNVESDLDIISKITSNLGTSGINFISSVEKVIPINKPVLLFYGIEQLATLYSYIHFNFTQENSHIKGVLSNFRIHGIDPFEFNNIKSSASIDEILNKKIRLLENGAAQRFFLVLGFPVKDFFFEKLEFSLLDLIHIFFTKLKIGFSRERVLKFYDDFSIEASYEIDYHQDLDLFVYYCLSFLFSHLSRYKIFTWQTLLQSEEKELPFYIKYLIERISNLFTTKIFSILYFQKDQMKIIISRNKSK